MTHEPWPYFCSAEFRAKWMELNGTDLFFGMRLTVHTKTPVDFEPDLLPHADGDGPVITEAMIDDA